MDVCYRLRGLDFVWDARKSALNERKHDGITFTHAAEVFFDPLSVRTDASRGGECRDALIGRTLAHGVLCVVHMELSGELVRIISARRATPTERKTYDS